MHKGWKVYLPIIVAVLDAIHTINIIELENLHNTYAIIPKFH